MAKKSLFEVAVTFGDVSFGEGTGRVGLKIDRSSLNFTNAEKYFVGKRVRLELVARSGNADAEQPSFAEADNDVKIAGTFDLKSIGLGPKKWSSGATFVPSGGDAEAFLFLPKRRGVLRVLECETLPAKGPGRPKKKADDSDDDGEGGDE